jgi:hypothetical protein
MFYKVHISSEDKISGTTSEGLYNIQVPVDSGTSEYNWQLAIESFMISGVANAPYMVVLASIPFKDSTYSTTFKQNTSIGLINSGGLYQRGIAYNSIGLPIADPIALRNTNIRVIICDPLFGDQMSSTGWSMILTIYGNKKEI